MDCVSVKMEAVLEMTRGSDEGHQVGRGALAGEGEGLAGKQTGDNPAAGCGSIENKTGVAFKFSLKGTKVTGRREVWRSGDSCHKDRRFEQVFE